jgi:hypothetical protein
MTVDLTELDGVGPARSGDLEEAGYDDFETIADADHEALAEEAEIPEDTALDFVVQSQNIVAEEDAEVEESQPVTEEVAEAVEEAEDEEVEAEEAVEELPDEEEFEEEFEEDDAEADDDEPESASETVEDEGPTEYGFSVTFESGLEYDTFFDAVMSQRSTMLQSNRTGTEAFDHALEQMRNGGMDEPVELEMTEAELNNLHNSVRQTTISYKGDNLIDHMDALNNILDQVNEARDEHLF